MIVPEKENRTLGDKPSNANPFPGPDPARYLWSTTKAPRHKEVFGHTDFSLCVFVVSPSPSFLRVLSGFSSIPIRDQ
jgi:hypothetical protein